jgi:phage portal protein BeeE
MTNLLSTLRAPRVRADGQISIDDWLSFFSFDGLHPILNQTLAGGKTQEILPTLSGLAEGAFKDNGVVFSCIVARMQLFSEARFKYRPKGSYANGDLYGKPSLELLERPWPRGTTRDLLSLMSLYEQIAGNAYVWREDAKTLRTPRPDWVTIVLGTRREDGKVGDIDTEVLGYAYKPNGHGEPQVMLPEHTAHYMPVPDPGLQWKGISWLQPVIGEIRGDNSAATYKRKFFDNGATANMVVTLDASITPEEFDAWVDKFEEGHKGALNAFKTIYLAGGADAKVVGANMQQIDFKSTQAHDEARICNAARIPPIIIGASEGLDAATYSNYGQARRAWADGSMRPAWGDVCETLEPLLTDVPLDSELWFDDRQISFLQEDRKDLVAIQQGQAAALKSLIDAGFKPDSAVAAINSGDLTKLSHTDLYSVQLQPPGTTFTPTSPSNGNGNAPAAPAPAK